MEINIRRDKILTADQPNFCRQTAFTLIELLVVISIIAVLASLLLPALSRSKAKAQSIRCENNLKQLQLAWFNYATDDADLLPLIISNGSRVLPGSWVLGNAQTDGDESNILSGVLYAYASALPLYHCPADRSTVPGSQLARLRSYSLNSWLCDRVAGVTLHLALARKYSDIRIPGVSGVFVFGDEHADSIDDGMWLTAQASNQDMLTVDGNTDTVDTEAWVDFPADRHTQGANFSFADGHVQFHHWKAPKIFQNHWQDANSGPDHDDLRWLQSTLPRLHY
jgi:prepilin-type N-terminal cleavage/methylation domain-containing protein/prepilin-type processing-associated H-X9-DG protein